MPHRAEGTGKELSATGGLSQQSLARSDIARHLFLCTCVCNSCCCVTNTRRAAARAPAATAPCHSTARHGGWAPALLEACRAGKPASLLPTCCAWGARCNCCGTDGHCAEP